MRCLVRCRVTCFANTSLIVAPVFMRVPTSKSEVLSIFCNISQKNTNLHFFFPKFGSYGIIVYICIQSGKNMLCGVNVMPKTCFERYNNLKPKRI